jgi:hypothetical protein
MDEKRKELIYVIVGKPVGTRLLEDKNVGGMLTLRPILYRLDGVLWAGLVWVRIEKIA